MTAYARTLFGLCAALFGAVGLLWHDTEAAQHLAAFAHLPGAAIAGWVLAGAEIAGGLALLAARTARVGAVLLGIAFLAFALGTIPGILAAPKSYVQYGAFFEMFAVVCGAIAAYVTSGAKKARARAARDAARIGMGLCAASFAVSQIVYLSATAALVPAWLPPGQAFWANLTTGAFALAALALLVDRQARFAGRLLALMLGIIGALVWIPVVAAHPGVHDDWSELVLNYLIAGAVWSVAESA